jgi:ABC-type transporter Mla subunit MlaD
MPADNITLKDPAQFQRTLDSLAGLPGKVTEAAQQSKGVADDLSAAAAKAAADPAASPKVGSAFAQVLAALAAAAGSVAAGLPGAAESMAATTAELQTFAIGVTGTDDVAAEKVIEA